MKPQNITTATKWLLGLFIVTASLLACKKNIDQPAKQEEIAAATKSSKERGHLKQTKTFSSDVVVQWLNMQLNMLRLPLAPGTGSQGTDRCQAYCGIAVYEAVVGGMPAYQSLVNQLTDFPTMPATEPGKAYHWAASANAALAEMNRRLFPTTSVANKTSMNNLEATLQAIYAGEVNDATLQRSIEFGKEVATRVFTWATTDGSANVNSPYVPPVGLGLWVPTAILPSPPNPPGTPAPAVAPYYFQRRKMVSGVDNGTELAPPPPFSSTIGSPFYNMVKEVYDAGIALTPAQKALVDYFKDVPGYSPGGTYVALLTQAFDLTKPGLDMAALAYAKVGIAQFEATTVLFTDKYHFNLIRPVTYIRTYIDPAWSTYIPTPNHPEFPSGHSTTGGGVIGMMSNIFGEDFHITLHTYDYLGYSPRSYTSFTQMMNEISESRLYGGLHYRATLDKSTEQGRKVAQNILSKVKFKK